MKPYLHRVRLFDDVVGYDEAATNSRIRVLRYGQDGNAIPLVIGYYEFHKAYRPVEAEELAQHLIALAIAEKITLKLAIETTADLYPACTRTTPKAVLVNNTADVWPILEAGDIAAIPLFLIGGTMPSWHAWATNSQCWYWHDDGNLYLQAQPTPRNTP